MHAPCMLVVGVCVCVWECSCMDLGAVCTAPSWGREQHQPTTIITIHHPKRQILMFQKPRQPYSMVHPFLTNLLFSPLFSPAAAAAHKKRQQLQSIMLRRVQSVHCTVLYDEPAWHGVAEFRVLFFLFPPPFFPCPATRRQS